MADILKFPDKFANGKRLYRIPLYSDMDIDVVLFCVNAFGETDNRVIIDDLIKMDPVDVINVLTFRLNQSIFLILRKRISNALVSQLRKFPLNLRTDIL